jgi:hypothetical protein
MGIAYGTTTLHQATKGIVQDGLVLNLDAGVKESYSGGTTWRDLKGDNNGTLTNGPTFDRDKGGSIVFDGSDDYISVSNSASLQIDNPDGITISSWVNPDTVSGGDSFGSSNPRYIVAKGRSPLSFNYALRLLGGKINFLYRDATNTNYVDVRQDVATVVVGSWQHIAVRFDSSGYALILNGVEVASTLTSGAISQSPAINADALVIGIEGSLSQRYMNGRVVGIHIYNRALTAAEVLQNFNVMRHRFGI